MEPDDKEDKKITTELVKLARAVRGAAAADVRRLLPQTWGLVRAGRQDADKEIEEYAQTVAHRATVAAMVSAKIRALESASNEGALGAVLAMRGMLARLQLRVVFAHSTGSFGETKMTEPAVAEYTPGGTTLVVMLGDTHWILRSARTWGDQWVSATGVRLDDLGQTRKSSGVEEPIVPLPSERTHRVSAVVRGAYAEPAIEGEKMHVLPLAGIRPGRSSGAVYRIQRHDIVAPTSFGSKKVGAGPARTAEQQVDDEKALKVHLDTAFNNGARGAELSSLSAANLGLVVVRKLLAIKLGYALGEGGVSLDTQKVASLVQSIGGRNVEWAKPLASESGDKNSLLFLNQIAEHFLLGKNIARDELQAKPSGLCSTLGSAFSFLAGNASKTTITDVMPSWLLDRVLTEPATRLVGVAYLDAFKDAINRDLITERGKEIVAAVRALKDADGKTGKSKFISAVLSDTCRENTSDKTEKHTGMIKKVHEMCSKSDVLKHVSVLYEEMGKVISGSPVLRIVRLYEYDREIKHAFGDKNANLENVNNELMGVQWYVSEDLGGGAASHTNLGVSHFHHVHAYTKLQILLVGERAVDYLWLHSFAEGHDDLANWVESERDDIVRSAKDIIDKKRITDLKEVLSESVAKWVEMNVEAILASEKKVGLAEIVRGVYEDVLNGAISTNKGSFAMDTMTTKGAIKKGFVSWLYKDDGCNIARRIRDARKKAGVKGNEDTKRADRLVDTSILYSDIDDHNQDPKNNDNKYSELEIDALHRAYDAGDLQELGNPSCLPSVILKEDITDDYVADCCCENSIVPGDENRVAEHIAVHAISIVKKHSQCKFLHLYVKGKGELERALEKRTGGRKVKLRDLFKICGGKWRAPGDFLASVVRKSDLDKFNIDSSVDQVHAAVLLGERLADEGYDGRGVGAPNDNVDRKSTQSELVAYAARVLYAESVNEEGINKVKRAYRLYTAQANKLDAADVFGARYAPPWVRVPEKEETQKFGSAYVAGVGDTIAVGLGFRNKSDEALSDAYFTFSAAQRLDHAYVWRIFGFAGLVRMVRKKVEPRDSIKATLTWIDASFKKTADEMVREWRRSSRKDDVQARYVEKAVNCGMHEWKYGIVYFAERIEASPPFAAWVAGIETGRAKIDAEYEAHAKSKDKLTGLAFLIGTRIVGDVVSVVTQEARTVQDEADLRLASDAVNALTKLAERFGLVGGTVKYYNLAHVTRIAEASGEVALEQCAVAALALSGVLFVVMDMLGLGSDAARLISEYLAALDRQLAHDVADVMELVARIVEDNDLFVAVKKAATGTGGIVTGAVGLRSIAEALVVAIKDPVSLASVAAALREVRVPGKGRKVHTEIRVRADQMRKVADDLSLMRERGASRRETKREPVSSDELIERARATAKVSIMDVLGDLQMRTLHVTGGEVLVLDQEAPDPTGRPNVRVELIVPGGYERWPSANDAFSTRFASVGGTVIGNATSWRGHLSGVCLLLVEESPELGTALRVEEENWRPIARVVPDALATRERVVVMRGPRAESKEIAKAKAVVLVVDAELAESIEKSLDVARVYAADGAESRASGAAGMLAARLRPLLWKKVPRACGSSVVASKTPRSASAHKLVERDCVADAMVLEYRLVREAVRAFGIGVELRPEVLNDKSPITDFVGRFAAWNKIAEWIAEHTLERMVKRYKEDLGNGAFDPLFSVKTEAIDDAHRRAKEIIAEAKEDPTEPLGALTAWKKLGTNEQKEVKKAVDKRSLDEPDLKWKSKDVDAKPVFAMIKESFGSS